MSRWRAATSSSASGKTAVYVSIRASSSGRKPTRPGDWESSRATLCNSPRYRSSTVLRCSARVSRMVLGPTFGLPSMSPPTQLPKRKMMPGRGGVSASAQTPAIACWRCSYTAGITRYRLSVRKNSTCSRSSATVMRVSGCSSVCQPEVSCARMFASRAARSCGVSEASMRSTSRRAICCCLSSMVRRVGSVGCAVKTGSINRLFRKVSASAGAGLCSASSCIAASRLSGRSCRVSRSHSRRRRIRCTRSAMFTAWK